jgi:hypothetical protein
VVEIKDAGDEFHWSRPRIVGLAFGAVASPLFVAFAVFGHEEIGGIVWFAACVGLTIAYVRPTRLRSFVQRLIPTTAEKREGLRRLSGTAANHRLSPFGCPKSIGSPQSQPAAIGRKSGRAKIAQFVPLRGIQHFPKSDHPLIVSARDMIVAGSKRWCKT